MEYKLNYIYNHTLGNSDDFFVLHVNFKSHVFKEIKQIRAYNVQALIGNAGGYIGLFLGYTIKELPKLFQYVINKIIYKR